MFDFFDVFIYALPGPNVSRRVPTPPWRPVPETRAAVFLAALLGLPGVLVGIGSIWLIAHSSNDLLSPITGMVGIVGLVIGLFIVLHAAAGAVALWRRQPGARLMSFVVAGFMLPAGPLAGSVIGGGRGALLAVAVVAHGAVLIWALMTARARADFDRSLAGPGALPG